MDSGDFPLRGAAYDVGSFADFNFCFILCFSFSSSHVYFICYYLFVWKMS